jgi:hypothetical protein
MLSINSAGQLVSTVNGVASAGLAFPTTYAGFSITDGATTEAISSTDTIKFVSGPTSALIASVSSPDTVSYDLRTCADGEIFKFNGNTGTWDCAISSLRYYTEDTTAPNAAPTVGAGTQSVSIGDSTTTNGKRSITLGADSTTNGSNSQILGSNSTLDGSASYILGNENKSDSSNAGILGYGNSQVGSDSSYILGLKNSMDTSNEAYLL